jgi:hypothetical protein
LLTLETALHTLKLLQTLTASERSNVCAFKFDLLLLVQSLGRDGLSEYVNNVNMNMTTLIGKGIVGLRSECATIRRKLRRKDSDGISPQKSASISSSGRQVLLVCLADSEKNKLFNRSARKLHLLLERVKQ